MKVFSQYCQKCRAANVPGEELCLNCGTRLMIVTTPPSVRHEEQMMPSPYEAHLLERISNLEFRLGQLADRLGQSLDLMLRQSRTIQLDHLLIETLVESLSAAGMVESSQINENWHERVRLENAKNSVSEQREAIQQKILQHRNATRTSVFTGLVKDGFRLLNREELAEGLLKLERAAALAPDNFALLAFLGEQHFRRDQKTLARDYLERARALVPKDEKVRLLLGLACLEEGDLAEAETILQPLCENRKLAFVAGFALGFLCAAQSRWAESLVAFKKMHLANSAAETHYLIASAYQQSGREKLAARHLQKAVEIDVNFADAWFMIGANYLRQSDEVGAKSALSMAVAAKDSGAQCHALLKNPKRQAELSAIPLVFLRLPHTPKNILGSLNERLSKIYREKLDEILFELKPV